MNGVWTGHEPTDPLMLPPAPRHGHDALQRVVLHLLGAAGLAWALSTAAWDFAAVIAFCWIGLAVAFSEWPE